MVNLTSYTILTNKNKSNYLLSLRIKKKSIHHENTNLVVVKVIRYLCWKEDSAEKSKPKHLIINVSKY